MSTRPATAVVDGAPGSPEAEGLSPLRLFGRRFVRHRMAIAGLVVLAALLLMAVFAEWISPHDPYYIDPNAFQDPPSRSHPLGTDAVGRDVLSRLIHASRVSLSVGIVAVGIYVAIGVVLGSIAGYYGGWVDTAIMRLADVVLSFPSLMLILVVVSMVGPSIYNIMLVLGLLGWPGVCRIVRGNFLTLREQEFVQAGRALGLGDRVLIYRHILPNAFAPVLVAATFGTANAILTEAALSFLGLGVQPPRASWGNLLTEAQSLTILEQMPWLWVPPGLMILVSVLAINFVGDALRDALDPRLKV